MEAGDGGRGSGEGRGTIAFGERRVGQPRAGAEDGASGALEAPVRVGFQEIHIGDVVTVYTLGLGPASPGFTGVVLRSTPSYLHLGLFAHEGESGTSHRPVVAEAMIRYDQIACVVRRISR